MTRRRFSAKALTALLLEHGGRCAVEDCRVKLGGAHGRIEWDHVIPIAMGGEDKIDNLQPLCAACHKAKTATDKKHIAKAARMQQREAGIPRQTSRPILGSKASGLKKKFNGEVERR